MRTGGPRLYRAVRVEPVHAVGGLVRSPQGRAGTAEAADDGDGRWSPEGALHPQRDLHMLWEAEPEKRLQIGVFRGQIGVFRERIGVFRDQIGVFLEHAACRA